ncbi:hypothetical protein ACLOJK_036599 [Asimina triloba]
MVGNLRPVLKLARKISGYKETTELSEPTPNKEIRAGNFRRLFVPLQLNSMDSLDKIGRRAENLGMQIGL